MKKKHKNLTADRKKELLSKESKKSKAYKEILRFVLLFIGLLIPFVLLISLNAENLLPLPVSELELFTTQSVGLVLNLFGMGAIVNQQILSLDNFTLKIVIECTGLYEIFIFLAAMLAYPANFKKKLWGAFLGIPFIFLLNLFRMVFITVISNYNPGAFEFLHLYFWQVALILIILCTWILWIEKIVQSERF